MQKTKTSFISRLSYLILIVSIVLFVCSNLSAQSMSGTIDTVPPVIKINYNSGKYKEPLSIKFTANEPSNIFYTLDGSQPSDRSSEYRGLLSISEEGRTVLKFVAYDMVGNKSREYENVYLIDTHSPIVDFSPASGIYSSEVNLKIRINERGNIRYSIDRGPFIEFKDSLKIAKTCSLLVSAEDETGNKSEEISVWYIIDKNVPVVSASREGGIFDKPFKLELSSGSDVRIFYTFDEFAPLISYQRYVNPIQIKNGQTIVSFYGENVLGTRSDVLKKIYTIDNHPPKVSVLVKEDQDRRVLILRASEKADLTYTTDGSVPTSKSAQYTTPIPIPKKGLLNIRVFARDPAGNESTDFQQKFSYDVTPPVVILEPKPGLYNKPIKILLINNKPGKIFYTLDNTLPDKNSNVYMSPISLTRDSRLVLTYFAIDEVGNQSDYSSVVYNLDQTPPRITPKIEKGSEKANFLVSFELVKGDSLYYTIGGGVPSVMSTKYTAPIEVKGGSILRYIAIDSAGNKTDIQEMTDLALPKVTATPPGGIYKNVTRVALASNIPGKILYRMRSRAQDMQDFQSYSEPLLLNVNGLYKIDYCSEDKLGERSSITEESYLIDLFPPEINVYTQRNQVDSTVTIYFQSSENAAIYFTLDGTNPYNSPTAGVLGNKFFLSKDKLKLKQTQNLKINFIGEDAAGNRSEMYIFDVNLPTVIASPPEGHYNEILYVTLTTFNDATIYYTTDGLNPTDHSSIYKLPIPITKTTTLKYFAVDLYGFQGLVKGGSYQIDLPPRPDFVIDNDPVVEGLLLTFNASGSVDEESPTGSLQYRWDFENDGKWDTFFGRDPKAMMTYTSSGIKSVTLQVKDTAGLTSVLTRKIRVIKDCPRDMLPLFEGDRAFCMDRFEFPNIRDSMPFTDVTWVEAVMKCRGVGKDLCALSEWKAACMGRDNLSFPYGFTYDPRKCNTEGRAALPSGDRRDCVSADGVYDLTGNVWEWVIDRSEGYNVIAGGDYEYGKNARCDASFINLISNREKSVGFRCCK